MSLLRGVEKLDTEGALRNVIIDREISVTTTASLLLWAAGGVLVALGLVNLWFAGIGLWLSGVGGCLWIRGLVCRQSRREMTAFRLGRVMERETDSLHSV